MATRNTRTPIPPIQCVKLLQKRRHLGSASTSLKIEAPVVVNPETVSKNASIKFGIAPDKKKGSEPKILITIHDSATVTNPSLEYIALFFGKR